MAQLISMSFSLVLSDFRVWWLRRWNIVVAFLLESALLSLHVSSHNRQDPKWSWDHWLSVFTFQGKAKRKAAPSKEKQVDNIVAQIAEMESQNNAMRGYILETVSRGIRMALKEVRDSNFGPATLLNQYSKSHNLCDGAGTDRERTGSGCNLKSVGRASNSWHWYYDRKSSLNVLFLRNYIFGSSSESLFVCLVFSRGVHGWGYFNRGGHQELQEDQGYHQKDAQLSHLSLFLKIH